MILLVGVSTRAMLESAVNAGFSVISLDYFADEDAQRLSKVYSLAQDFGFELNSYNLLKAAKLLPCTDFVYASGPEHQPDELYYWEERGLLRGNTPQTVKDIRNPWCLQQVLAELEISMPAFYRIEEWLSQGKIYAGRKFLLKPLHRGGGSGIVTLPEESNTMRELLRNISTEQYIIQAYIEGLPASVTFLADGQEAVVLGTSRQLISMETGDFTYVGNIVPLSSLYSEKIPRFDDLLIKMVNHLTDAFKLRGLNTVDFLVSTEGIHVLEVNPRWSGSVELLERQLGLALFPYHIDPCGVAQFLKEQRDSEENIRTKKGITNRNNEGMIRSNNEGFWGKQIVYASEEMKLRKNLEVSSLIEQGMRDISSPGTVIKRGQPLCTVFAWAETEEDCLVSLKEKSIWAKQVLQEEQLKANLK